MATITLDPAKRRRLARSFYRRWNWRRQLVASGLRLFVAGIFALCVWGAWYLANKGFSREWRTTIAQELRKRGVEASVRRLTLDPFRGLIAQDLRVYEFNRRDNPPLAVISEVALDINYAALLHRQPFLNALDIRDADVTFPNPGGDPKAPKAQLKQFRAHVYFPPEQLFISHADGVFCGVRISASGQLLKRGDYQPTRVVTEEEWRRRMQLLQRVAGELARFNFAGGSPTLQLKFTGDVAHLEDARVEATLRGERIQRGAYELRSVNVAANWSERTLTVSPVEVIDTAGALSARATWNATTRAGDFQAQSSVDARQFLDVLGLGHLLADASFAAPPEIELSGSVDLAQPKPRLTAIGNVALGAFTFKAAPFLGLTSAFAWDGERMMLRDVRLRHESGELRADLLDAPGDFRLNVESTLNPGELRPLTPPEAAKFLGEWEWRRSPDVRLAIRGRGRDPQTWAGEGRVALPRTRFRGAWLNSATADVHFADGALTFSNLHVARDEGTGTGAFTYDFAKHEVRVENVRTSLRPLDAMHWIEPKLVDVITPYRFRAPPNLRANGVVTLHGRRETALHIDVDAPGGMEYDFIGKTLQLDKVHGHLLITDDDVLLQNVGGSVFDGAVRLNAAVGIGRNEDHVRASVEVEGVDFPKLTELYFNFKTARGQMSGSYAFDAVGEIARNMHGTGQIKVSNGDVFAIPVFGPLSGLVSAIIPGAGYSIAKQATATFTIRDGVIHTDDFKVSGKLFGMLGHGDIYFLENRLDFDIRISANAGPGVLLTPMYKLFEYKGDGSVSKPNWHPKNF